MDAPFEEVPPAAPFSDWSLSATGHVEPERLAADLLGVGSVAAAGDATRAYGDPAGVGTLPLSLPI